MIEVFKTNVQNREQAMLLLTQLHQCFAAYTANFDLVDCDNILRVKCTTGVVHAGSIIDFMNEFGFEAEVLPDEPPAEKSIWIDAKRLLTEGYNHWQASQLYQ